MLEGSEPTSSSRSKRASGPDDSQKSKRVRVSRACDQCRAGREKCDGAQPRCNTCVAQRRPCSYHEQPKKRGIQPHYIRTLELTLAWMFVAHPDLENRLSSLLPDPQESAHTLIASRDVTASEALHTTWRHSTVCRQIDQLLSGSDVEAPRADAAVDAFSDLLSLPIDGATLSDPLQQGELFSRQPEVESLSEILILPTDSWSLLEHFFAFTHAWLPFTEKHDILRLMYSYPPQGLRREEATAAGHAELWGIMALAASQTTSDGALGDAEKFRRIARDLLPVEHGVFQISHVKAFLLLALIDIAEHKWLPAWLLVGSAIRVVTHIQSSGEKDVDSSRARHALLAAFVLETTIAARTTAQTHLQPGHIKILGPLVEDGIDEWSPWHDPGSTSSLAIQRSPASSISTFNSLVSRATRSHGKIGDHTNASTSLDVVFTLLLNASARNGRVQPSVIVADSTPADHLDPPAMTASQPAYDTGNSEDDLLNLPSLDKQFELITSMPPVTSNSNALYEPAVDLNADIFEEFAQLERTESSSSSHPNFMQNLGFGPDVDLAEFFGADYQPSDPILAYTILPTQKG